MSQKSSNKNMISKPVKIFLALVAFLICYSASIPFINNEISFGKRSDALKTTALSDPLKILLPIGAGVALWYIIDNFVESDVTAVFIFLLLSGALVVLGFFVSFNLYFGT